MNRKKKNSLIPRSEHLFAPTGMWTSKEPVANFLPLCMGVLLLLIGLVSCGDGDNGTSQNLTTNTVTVTISDPPTCKAPVGDLESVWVTITQVRVHRSSAADSNDSGWVDLLDLRDAPKQIDLLDTSDTTCILATLGATIGLPPGDYQQIRLHLLSNTPAPGAATPVPNNCGSQGFNCIELATGAVEALLLGSEAQTGIKIPPGRIAGGAIALQAGQSANINIDFNACNSIVRQGNRRFRLKPTLHAGEVSLTTESISGRAVDDNTGSPIPNATIVVLAEQPDTDGIDRVVMQTLASATQGTFTLCPLPPGNYDIVVDALSASGVTYNATITFGVPVGTDMGDIPLKPETGADTSPGTIEGLVTTADTDSDAVEADIALSALQEATPTGGSSRLVTIPLLGDSTSNVATEDIPECPSGTACASYSLFVPASNPVVGTFSTSGTAYAEPQGGAVLYSVNAQAFIPGSGGIPTCSPSSLSIDLDADGNPLAVTAGATTTAEPLIFSSCETDF